MSCTPAQSGQLFLLALCKLRSKERKAPGSATQACLKRITFHVYFLFSCRFAPKIGFFSHSLLDSRLGSQDHHCTGTTAPPLYGDNRTTGPQDHHCTGTSGPQLFRDPTRPPQGLDTRPALLLLGPRPGCSARGLNVGPPAWMPLSQAEAPIFNCACGSSGLNSSGIG